ncbi:hypothetical protein C8R43DRAFT_1051400 [Mycena crocata]|nr:hypothetical protein C8R43DRAFT_1051400 [Mycena crocata]
MSTIPSTPGSESQDRVLSALAAVGLACYKCHAQPSDSVTLQKCSSCRLVSYCNSACQLESWPTHKLFCRVMTEFEKSGVGRFIGDDFDTYFKLRNIYCVDKLGRVFSNHEHRLLQFEPRCLSCGRTDQMSRATALPAVAGALVPCPECQLSFACEHHWSFSHAVHTQAMCEGGYDGLPQCHLNRELLENENWDTEMLRLPRLPQYAAPLRAYRWIPASRSDSWHSLKNVTWADKFQSQLESEFPASRGPASNVWMRRMSDVLSMPMTALYSLELLNDNLDWTKKKSLTIHIIGAHRVQLFNATMFENILHQLPQVKEVTTILCGVFLEPDLGTDLRGGPFEINCCEDCVRRGRKRFNEYYAIHYENLPAAMGSRFRRPDLAIAFECGAAGGPPEVASWKKTIDFLVARNIPTVFTTYPQEEALDHHALLVAAGARLVPGLGPCRNPWGSLYAMKDAEIHRGFYSENMCLAGGMKAL